MKMLMAMMLVLALPLILVAGDGWRTWDSPTPAKKSAPVTEWIPDVPAAATVIFSHPLAAALNEEGFPPRSAALAAKETETIKREMPAVPVASDAACLANGSCGTVTSSGYVISNNNYSTGGCSGGSCGAPTRRGLFSGRR